MARRLDTWPRFECSDVREMAALGMSARAIARSTGATLGAVLSAAPDCFERADPWPAPEAPETSDRQEVIERVRVLQATGANTGEIAQVLGVSRAMVNWASHMARQQRLHRQKPMRSRA